MANYYYRVNLGKATVSINDGERVKALYNGKLGDDDKAKAACLAHYEKVCRAAQNFGHAQPTMFFI